MASKAMIYVLLLWEPFTIGLLSW